MFTVARPAASGPGLARHIQVSPAGPPWAHEDATERARFERELLFALDHAINLESLLPVNRNGLLRILQTR